MKRSHPELIIYTDGGSRGNPGPAAIGVAFADGHGRILKRYAKTLGRKTNNEAEYEAVRFALAKARALYGKERIKAMTVEMRMDSELIARQLAGEYKVEEERLWPFFMEIWNIRRDFGALSFRHVRREENREADRLVNEALDSEQGRLL
ncbi:MAG: ribonuclease HI family protein [Candidatus Sungbacteria bacterium]|uniref:Ribonuclease HI family protein n=1 Tax=Candidatus Sungiibacteriota bacterium TaxID=2750080 RepID=A0A932YVC0_9BACT|nr:ribonuclease HI family protein [Candidatus Sungbacteria bacterium]